MCRCFDRVVVCLLAGLLAGGCQTTPRSDDPGGYGVISDPRVRQLIHESANGMQKGDLPAALQKSAEAVALGPDCSAAHAQHATVLYELRDLDGAIAGFCRSLELTPNASFSRVKLANAYLEKGRYDEAINDVLKMQEVKPLAGSVELTLACLLKGDWGSVDGHATRMITAFKNANVPPSPLLFAYRGEARRHLGAFDAALADLNGAIRLDGRRQPMFYLWRGLAFDQRPATGNRRLEEKLKDYNSAVRDYQAFLAFKPEPWPAILHGQAVYSRYLPVPALSSRQIATLEARIKRLEGPEDYGAMSGGIERFDFDYSVKLPMSSSDLPR
jgi:tetratricopeptide (TPR) repeat protein